MKEKIRWKIVSQMKTDFEAEIGIELHINIMAPDIIEEQKKEHFKQSVEQNSIKLNVNMNFKK